MSGEHGSDAACVAGTKVNHRDGSAETGEIGAQLESSEPPFRFHAPVRNFRAAV